MKKISKNAPLPEVVSRRNRRRLTATEIHADLDRLCEGAPSQDGQAALRDLRQSYTEGSVISLLGIAGGRKKRDPKEMEKACKAMADDAAGFVKITV